MQVTNLEDLKEFSNVDFIKKELLVTDNFKLLLICFEPGQEVPPCVMERSTAFYYDLYATAETIAWDYRQQRPYKKDELKGKRRLYLHLYYNSEKATEDERRQNLLLMKLQQELLDGNRKQEHEKLYAKYFEVHSTPVRGTKVKAKQEAIDEAKKNYGYFALISNEIKDPIEALATYRNKDLVEKAFGNLKERLNLRRTLVSSELSLDGKLFVEFVALIYLSYIKKQMQEHALFKKYTLQGLLDELEVIECFEQLA